MLTAHQRLHLRRAGLRVEDETGASIIAILDHPTIAIARHFGACGGDEARKDLPPIVWSFVAFGLRRHEWSAIIKLTDDLSRIDPEVEWTVTALNGRPDVDGVYYVPQLDARGEEALAFLRAFVAGLN